MMTGAPSPFMNCSVTIIFSMLLSDGLVNIRSIMAFSMMVRKPRAPVSSAMALSAVSYTHLTLPTTLTV